MSTAAAESRPWWAVHVHPSQFAFVMATGIVSTALHNAGADRLSLAMLWCAVVGYLVLVSVIAVRWAHPAVAAADLVADRFGLFAFTAASGVLGAHFGAMKIDWAAVTLTFVAMISWLIAGYVIVAYVVTHADRRGDQHGLRSVNGTWFLTAVATQSLAVTAAIQAARGHQPGFALLAAMCWGIGLCQLMIIAVLVAARLLTVGLAPSDEVAPYWVFMGSGVISVLAGAELLHIGPEQRWLDPAVIGSMCMVLWSAATWLIPLVIALMVWQARRPGAVTGFRMALWSMVFPIGMYGEASRELGVIRHFPRLARLGSDEAWIAFAIWAVVAVGMLASWLRWWRTRTAARA